MPGFWGWERGVTFPVYLLSFVLSCRDEWTGGGILGVEFYLFMFESILFCLVMGVEEMSLLLLLSLLLLRVFFCQWYLE